MKLTITLLFSCLLSWSFCQIKSSWPALENASEVGIDFIEPLYPGRKIVFTQNCNKALPDTVSNGIVQFENVHILDDKLIASVVFKDTVVERIIFEFQTGDNEIVAFFKVPMDKFTELSRKSYYQSYSLDGFEYSCYINRRKVTLIKALPAAR